MELLVSGGCSSSITRKRSQELEDNLKRVSSNLRKHLQASRASFISFQVSSSNRWLQTFFFSAFILKVPAANTYLNCHWLTPTDERVRFPKINVPQENHSFGQVHIGYESLQLPGVSFNQLYCIGAHYTKPAGFADINARTMKNPTFCGPTRKSNPLQSLLSSRGSGVEIAHSDYSLFGHPRSLAI